MFATTMSPAISLAFPDVCNVPIMGAPVPMPLVNISESSLAVPAAYTVLMDCMPTVTESSFNLLSEGDEAGLELGICSFMESGQTMYLLGNLTIYAWGMPVQRMTSITEQNCLVVLPNTVGCTLSPSQCTVLTLG